MTRHMSQARHTEYVSRRHTDKERSRERATARAAKRFVTGSQQ